MTIGGLINDLAGLVGAGQTPYLDQLQEAKWKGVPFAVKASRGHFGRRNAVHDYPYRDTPWAEDLGRARRRFQVTGFLVGNDVIAQSNRMIAACEKRNESDAGGELVHPIYGKISVVLLDFAITQSVEGQHAELEFDFLASSQRVYPVANAASPTGAAAAAADSAASQSFLARVVTALQDAYAASKKIIAVVQKYGGIVFRLVNDATSLIKTVQNLPGLFGRFFAGASSTLFGMTSAASTKPTTVPQLIAAGAQARANVTSTMNAASAGAASLSAGTALTFAGQVQAVTSALTAATTDPADQVRLFTDMATAAPSTDTTLATQVTADLWRRAALTALARATAAYQPASYDDAANLRGAVVALLEAEIGIAGDQGEDDVFLAFRGLKAAGAADLTARGATLSPIVTVSFPAALPAPLLAMKLYQDASRADQLIGQANCRHPAFMPVSFRALAQ